VIIIALEHLKLCARNTAQLKGITEFIVSYFWRLLGSINQHYWSKNLKKYTTFRHEMHIIYFDEFSVSRSDRSALRVCHDRRLRCRSGDPPGCGSCPWCWPLFTNHWSSVPSWRPTENPSSFFFRSSPSVPATGSQHHLVNQRHTRQVRPFVIVRVH